MKIYKVTLAQYKTLQQEGSIIVSGQTYQYDESATYIVIDPWAPEYRLQYHGSDNTLQLTKDGGIVSTVSVRYADSAGKAVSLGNVFTANSLRTELDEIKASAGGVTASITGKTLIIS